jgi:Kef-type K+ transport system membrane component KefB
LIFAINISLIISFILGLSLFHSVLIAILAINSSTSLVYKFSENRIDEEDRKLMSAVASLEDVVAFLGLIFVLSSRITFINLLNIFIFSISIILLGYLLSKFLIKPSIKYSDDMVILSAIGSLLLINLVSDQIKVPATFGVLLLGLATSIAIIDTSRLIIVLRPIRDLMLIFFFIYTGSLFQFNMINILLFPISLIIIFNKFIAFGFGSWISGIDFIRAFRNALYMTALSEISIIISLIAIDNGIDIGLAYSLSIITVSLGIFISSILIKFENNILKLISKFNNKIENIDKLLKNVRLDQIFRRSTKFEKIIGLLVSIIAIFISSLILIEIISINFPQLLILLIPVIAILSPSLGLVLLWEINKEVQKVEFRRVTFSLSFILYLYLIILFEQIIFNYLQNISFLEYAIIIAMVVLTIIFYKRLVALGKEIGRIFTSQ